MNRHRAYWPLDDAPQIDGDAAFRGVNMRDHPAQLADGMVSEAVNCRFDGGRIIPRRGARLLSWSNRLSATDSASLILGYGTVHGAGVFSDPTSGLEWLVVASQDAQGRLQVWRCRPGNASATVPVPVAQAGPVAFIQTLDGLVMLRGAAADPLYAVNLDIGFGDRPIPDPGFYTPVPRASRGIYWQNRLMVVNAGQTADAVDTIWVSDFGATEATLRGPVDAWNNFRINPGTADRLTAIYPLTETTLLVVKNGSVYAIANVTGTAEQIAANAVLETITTEYGSQAPRSLVQVGRDVWFLGHRRGVCSVRLTEQGKSQAVDVPVSRDLDPVIRRINWQAAAGACAAFWGNRVYMAVPLDDSTANNAVLVYDTQNGAWSGYDTGTAIAVREWLKVTWQGEERLFYVSEAGTIHLYEDGAADQTTSETGVVTWHEITTRVVTRAYGGRAAGRKRFGKLRLRLSTWWPTFDVATRTDGQGEREVLRSGVQRDRTAWTKVDREPADATNANDDHGAPYREDYSVEPPFWCGANGITPEAEQETPCTWPARRRGDYCQVEITGTRGRVSILSAELENSRDGVLYGKEH